MFKRSKKRAFAAISNQLLQDTNMPAGPLALVVYLLSKPDDWEGHTSDIERRFGIKTDARRSWTIQAEQQGYLAFRRVRKSDGSISQFYEAYDEPLPPEERTDSRQHLKIPITDEPTPPQENPGVPTPGSSGGPPPDEPVPAEPVPAEPVMAEPGVTNKEITKTEGTKKEGQSPPRLWQRYNEFFGHDILAAYPEAVRDAAFDVVEYQYMQDKPGGVPCAMPTFQRDVEYWAKCLAANSRGNAAVLDGLVKRVMSYLSLSRTERHYGKPVWKMADDVGIGEKHAGKPTMPLAPAKSPETVQAELFQRRVGDCAESIKAAIRRDPELGIVDATNLQSKYALDVRTAAMQAVMRDEDFAREWEGLKRNGPPRIRNRSA